MSDKLDRFTKRTQQVLSQAVEEARRLNHDYVGTEHLLLGLVKEEDGITAKVLRTMDVRPTHVIRSLKRLMAERGGAPVGRPALTPSTKRVIQAAIDEARNMGHHYIDPGHLLLGLVAHEQCIATQALEKLGVDPQRLRTGVPPPDHCMGTG